MQCPSHPFSHAIPPSFPPHPFIPHSPIGPRGRAAGLGFGRALIHLDSWSPNRTVNPAGYHLSLRGVTANQDVPFFLRLKSPPRVANRTHSCVVRLMSSRQVIKHYMQALGSFKTTGKARLFGPRSRAQPLAVGVWRPSKRCPKW